MKLTIISDTHGLHDSLELIPTSGEVLVHCGDISNIGALREIYKFINWVGNLDYQRVIFTLGNHDMSMEVASLRKQIYDYIKVMFPYKVIMLIDQEYVYKGVKFYGSPWSPTYGSWSFMKQDNKAGLGEKFKLIPNDVDVLITHAPPKGCMDYYVINEYHDKISVGSEMLKNELQTGRFTKLKIHCFGHIHNGYGVEFNNDVTYVNASVLDDSYNPRIVLDNDVMFHEI